MAGKSSCTQPLEAKGRCELGGSHWSEERKNIE
jgi:hypothetical protein